MENLGAYPKTATVVNDISAKKRILTPLEANLGHFEIDEEMKQKQLIKQLKKVQNQKLLVKRKAREQEEMDLKKERALKSMNYLLTKSLKFASFFKDRLQQHMQHDNSAAKAKGPMKTLKNGKIEPKLEDMLNDPLFQEDLEKKERSSSTDVLDILDQIKLFEGGVLKPYQVEGLAWMTILFENGVNGILADEMGLGKTVQVIALICHLYERKTPGPFLIVAPLSTIPNWESEFKRFAPKVPVVVFHGNKEERNDLHCNISSSSFKLFEAKVKPVVLTTYQIPLLEERFLAQFRWQYIIIDEGHRIKNHQSKLSLALRKLPSTNKLLLTGTPLQNNLTELWALLNFLLPHIFTDINTFASLFALEDMEDNNKIVTEEQSTNMISTIHKVLAPFMLRRLKCDVLQDLVPKKEVLVYCPMSKLQRDLYTYIIHRNLNKLGGKNEEEEEETIDPYEPRKKRRCTLHKKYTELSPDDIKDFFMEDFLKKEEEIIEDKLNKNIAKFIYNIKMQSPMIMFKQVVDHPYLIHFPLDPNSEKKQLLVNEQLVQESGKMLVLDAMIAKLKKRGHKILIFSTFVMLLDLIEDYVIMRNYKYCRLDGSLRLAERQKSIEEFNTNPNIFLFLISTRAGGLGLNLTAADTVILYDRDWNPQVDIQAQDRCHRIGQTKPVMVYTLVTKNTIDERIIKCGNMKRLLEKIVIKDGKFKSIKDEEKNKMETDFKELEELLQRSDNSTKIHSNGYVFTNEELDNLLDRSELYKEMEKMQPVKK